MRFYGDVIARKGKKYWIGRVKRGKFHPAEELNSLTTLDKLGTKYVTMTEYAKIVGLNLTIKELEDVRRKTEMTEVWVIDREPPKVRKDGDVSDSQWDKWYFRFLHSLCQKCQLDCKQSSRVDVICPKFKEMK
jgi:hypothetical protein